MVWEHAVWVKLLESSDNNFTFISRGHMLEDLKREVCLANLRLCELKLVILTWGNVSGVDRSRELFVIKPSGIDYAKLTADQMVVCDFEGNKVEGELSPSSDTPTHAFLYRSFPTIGGVTHTHSKYATSFAQAKRAIPCYGTTHADYFFGDIPVTRELREEEVESDYERNTGKVIAEHFQNIDYVATPGVLVASHGPFCWGRDANASVENSLVLENVAFMAIQTGVINPEVQSTKSYLINKHYQRKHGPQAYYGQSRR